MIPNNNPSELLDIGKLNNSIDSTAWNTSFGGFKKVVQKDSQGFSMLQKWIQLEQLIKHTISPFRTVGQFLESGNVNNGTYNNAKTTDKTWFLGAKNAITDNNISQFLDVAKENKSNENNATNPDNPTYFIILNIISNSNLTQFLDFAKVNNSNYNNENILIKHGFCVFKSDNNISQFLDVA